MSQSSVSHRFCEKAHAPLHVAYVIINDTVWKMLLRAKVFIMGEFAVRKNVPVWLFCQSGTCWDEVGFASQV